MADQQQPPGWGPQAPSPQGPQVRAWSDPKPPWYRRGWVLFLAGLLLGGILGSAAATDQQPQQRAATVTSVVKEPYPVFTDNCVELRNELERTVCERIKTSLREEGAATATTIRTTTTPPKPKPAPAPTYGDGVYEVGAEIKPGTYKTRAEGNPCYWARLADPDGDNILANHLGEGLMTLRIRSSDRFIELSGGCEWRRSG